MFCRTSGLKYKVKGKKNQEDKDDKSMNLKKLAKK